MQFRVGRRADVDVLRSALQASDNAAVEVRISLESDSHGGLAAAWQSVPRSRYANAHVETRIGRRQELVNQDFRDLLAEFNAHKVEFLVVGAHALAAHGCVRATKDLDLWVRPELANAKRIISALRAFGAPLQDLAETDLTTAGLTFQAGLPPLRAQPNPFGRVWQSRP